MKFPFKFIALSALMTVGSLALAQKGETVRIAVMDPMSGAFANMGPGMVRQWQYSADRLASKNAAGVKFEFGVFDNKNSPQESLNTFKAAVDQGYRYVAQGAGSGAAAAIIDAVAKHNERNPGKEVMYLNYNALDPALTNEKCDYWHFRFDADTSMRMEALTSFMKDQPKVGKVYLFNQNYSHGQQVAKYFKEGIGRKRPDVKIVGEELIPLGQVKDFAPYVAKIKQSGADTVVTGNWGQDLTLLVRAMNDAGLKIPTYTFFAYLPGTPTALAAAGDSEVYLVSYNHVNHGGEMGSIIADYKKKFANINEDYVLGSTYNGINMLSAAMAKARSTDPVKVAKAMENLTVKSFAGEVQMRASDHQLQQSLFISKWQKADKQYPYAMEATAYTFAPVKQLDPYVSSTPTSCQMKRPANAS